MNVTLTRKEMDSMKCVDPDCTNTAECGHTMRLFAHCHPLAPLVVRYSPGGILELTCWFCHTWVTDIQVADE